MTEKREQVIKGEGWGINGDENRLEFYVLCRVYNTSQAIRNKITASPNPFPLEAKEGNDRHVWGAKPRGPLLQTLEPGSGWVTA